MLAYLTDVEGQWEKLRSFADDSPCVRLTPDGALVVAPGSTFVFGGDAIDRGDASRRVVSALVEAKRRQPSQVVLLAGNRDLNKMRLVRELAGYPHRKVPAEMRGASPGALLQWTFAHTMGARGAFEHRRAELAAEGRAADDESVARSFLDDLAPGGDLTRYLETSQLAWLGDGTLAVHGAVTDENLGVVPGHDDRVASVPAWVDALNAFHRAEVAAWRCSLGVAPDGGEAYPGRALIDYQAPIGETRLHQSSVVYGRPTDDANNPHLPPPRVLDALRRDGVQRLLLGHTPSGDAPALLRDEGFTLVMGDNSYGRVEVGSRVHVDGDAVLVRGETRLDDGTHAAVSSALGGHERDPFLGLRDVATGQLVKARLAGGDYLLFRSFPGNKVEQVAATSASLRGRTLVAPHRG